MLKDQPVQTNNGTLTGKMVMFDNSTSSEPSEVEKLKAENADLKKQVANLQSQLSVSLEIIKRLTDEKEYK